MKTAIAIPDDLRSRVEDFIPQVRKAIAEVESEQTSAGKEIKKLHSEHMQLSERIEGLRGLALSSDKKAAELATAEKRRDLIAERIDLLKREARERHQVKLWGSGELLRDIARHWSKELPGVIQSALAPFCGENVASINAIVKMCDCQRVLQQLVTSSHLDDAPAATDSRIQWHENLFARVLRGQPHLGFDYYGADETATEAAS